MEKLLGVSLNYIEDHHRRWLEEAGSRLGYKVVFADDPETAGDLLKDVEVLFTSGPDAVGLCGSGLRWVCASFAGIDAYCGPKADPLFEGKDCILSNSAGVYGHTISEHIIMTALMIMRDMPQYIQDQQQKVWGKMIPMRSIMGSRFTMLGAGDIAITTAKKLRALGASEINGVSRSGREREAGVFDRMFRIDQLAEILPETDVLVMSLPGTQETAGILSGDMIMQMPSHAIVINVGRGPAIDHEALADALDEGRLMGAALDVFPQEPLPADSRLWTTKNLVITPHTAGNMTLQYTRDKSVQQFIEDLERWTAGETPLHITDRSVGY